jgi:hypothetical protein
MREEYKKHIRVSGDQREGNQLLRISEPDSLIFWYSAN